MRGVQPIKRGAEDEEKGTSGTRGRQRLGVNPTVRARPGGETSTREKPEKV